MPVYLYTFHAYRTWNADNPRGFVEQGRGILPPDARKARWRNIIAKHAPVRFDASQHSVLIDGCRDICGRRGWRLHQVVVVSSHVHALVSWRDSQVRWQFVRDTMKRLLGWMLAKHSGVKGHKWFSRKGSRKRVRGRRHFDHLALRYLPSHARGFRGGSGWCEVRGYFGKAYGGRLIN